MRDDLSRPLSPDYSALKVLESLIPFRRTRKDRSQESRDKSLKLIAKIWRSVFTLAQIHEIPANISVVIRDTRTSKMLIWSSLHSGS